MCPQVTVLGWDLQAPGFLWAWILAGLASQEEWVWQGHESCGMAKGGALSPCLLSPSFVPVTHSPSVFQRPNSCPSKTFHRH